VSITRFKRLLPRARLDVRRLAHTLHIPPAEQEFYGGPQAGWLRDILDRLPSLQALIVSNLSFFDHQSLQNIHQSSKAPIENSTNYPLRLLSASECSNTTASSLVSALLHFPGLIYLDLSGAQGSRNHHVLHQIGLLSELQILKLRNCGLRDDDIEYLKFSNRLRSLDVSQNFLTEKGIAMITERLPAAKPIRIRDSDSIMTMSSSRSPYPRRYSGIPLPLQVLDDGLESFVVDRLTSGHDGHLTIEEGLPPNFTHLYLASNYLTIDDINRLKQHPSLQYLDCGFLNLSNRPFEMFSPRSPGSGTRRFSDPPEEEILSPALFTSAFRNLRSLRIHHSVITSYPFSGKDLATSEQCYELHSEDLRFELDSTEIVNPDTIFELDDTSINVLETEEPKEPTEAKASTEPKDSADTKESAEATKPTETAEASDVSSEVHATFEGPDDVGADLVSPVSPIDSNGHWNMDFVEPEPEHQAPKRQSLYHQAVLPRLSVSANLHSAHLHVGNQQVTYPATSVTSVPPVGPERFHYNYAVGEERPWREALNNPRKPTSIRELIDEITQRRHRTEARERRPRRFKPSMLPNLKTLMLTDVPLSTRRRSVPESLRLFIQECAEEEELAQLEDLLKHQDETYAPNWDYCPTTPLKLQQLVLEMTSQPEPAFPPRSPHRSSYPRHRPKRESFTKSSTEDPDSEMFMNASMSDFSFFGEDDGGLLVSEGRIDSPMFYDEGLILEREEYGHLIDVVSELASFRREKRKRFEATERFVTPCRIERALLGHWVGEVKVVRKSGK
jgi:Leucine-rich repeat (LRR) protein